VQSNRLLEKLSAGKVVLGLTNMYPASGILEGMCQGWDFVWLDGQHGEHDYRSLLHAVQCADRMGIDAMIRVPSHERGVLGMYADLAPAAIMVPMVDNAKQALAVAENLRFPPQGKRSYGGRRVIDRNGRNFFQEQKLLVVAQIETVQAIEEASQIIAVEGIDVLFYSPDDLKLSLGIEVNTPLDGHPKLLEALETVGNAAKAAGKYCGVPARSPELAVKCKSLGYQLIGGGNDAMFLRTSAVKALEDLTEALG